MDSVREGAKVKLKFGNVLVEGNVLGLTGNSALVKIAQPSTIVKVALSLILSFENPKAPDKIERPIIQPPVHDADGRINKQKSLESLRFGLVPNHALEDLTIGYEKIREWVLSRLPGNSNRLSTISEVCGAYGTGKSHMMALIRRLAKQHGYVTAHVEINGKDVSLEDPEALSAHLWKTVDAKGIETDTPLLDIYVHAIERNGRCPAITPRALIDRTQDNFNTIALIKRKGLLDTYSHDYNALLSCSNEITASELNQRICKEPSINRLLDQPKVRKVIGKTVDERPHDFIESLVGNAVICNLAGFKGLVITIDEFEIQRLGTKLDRVAAVIRHLMDYLNGKTGHKEAPLSIFIASVGMDGHLGDKIIDFMIEECAGEFYPLEVLGEDDCIELGRRIFDLYRDVYKVQGLYDEAQAKAIYGRINVEEGRVRKFIKYYIGVLDMKYGPPKRN